MELRNSIVINQAREVSSLKDFLNQSQAQIAALNSMVTNQAWEVSSLKDLLNQSQAQIAAQNSNGDQPGSGSDFFERSTPTISSSIERSGKRDLVFVRFAYLSPSRVDPL
ncbi:hypothetical protein GOP47_0008029 [Adiantum capillus-veneris]|uniref:Uncharacterized protein n=1 Tax=Adiantum capillus-veneris TaxID=13818 RepID=A0A9D4UXR6_ADICA|nr:hypothetical protein GOP47_0008029 [Adiantum capillus-veneris]